MISPLIEKSVAGSADPLSPQPQQSLADGVVVRLREAILRGRFAPGERLREEQLAQSLRVSRGPIREALRELEREGLVIIERNRGAYVARLSREDLDEVYSLRLALERLAVQRAVRHIEAEQLLEMQAVVETMQAYAGRGITEKEAADLDIRFHEIIYQASKHQRLYERWAILRPQIHVFLLGRNIAKIDFREDVIKGHQEIIDAVRAKDELVAVTAVEEHLRASYHRVLQSYVQRNSERRIPL